MSTGFGWHGLDLNPVRDPNLRYNLERLSRWAYSVEQRISLVVSQTGGESDEEPVNEGGVDVGVSGTINYLAKFTAINAVGDASALEDGTKLFVVDLPVGLASGQKLYWALDEDAALADAYVTMRAAAGPIAGTGSFIIQTAHDNGPGYELVDSIHIWGDRGYGLSDVNTTFYPGITLATTTVGTNDLRLFINWTDDVTRRPVLCTGYDPNDEQYRIDFTPRQDEDPAYYGTLEMDRQGNIDIYAVSETTPYPNAGYHLYNDSVYLGADSSTIAAELSLSVTTGVLSPKGMHYFRITDYPGDGVQFGFNFYSQHVSVYTPSTPMYLTRDTVFGDTILHGEIRIPSGIDKQGYLLKAAWLAIGTDGWGLPANTALRGFFSIDAFYAATTLDAAYGVFSQPAVKATNTGTYAATFTNIYSIYAGIAEQSGTSTYTLTNAYSIYAKEPDVGTNKWGLYSTGNVGIANGKQLRLYESGSGNYSSFAAGTQSADLNYVLPTSIVASGYLQTDGSGNLSWATVSSTPDASVVTYTPAVLTDWDADTDPGDVDNALDQLAERVDDLEAAPPSHAHDASAVTYTPAVLADWDADTDPGNVDDALDQLAAHVDDLLAGGGAPADAQYVVIADSAGLSQDRVLTAGAGISITTNATQVTVAVDDDDIPFTATTATDWNGDVDPGDVDDALDQLASRVNSLEGAPPAHVHDASAVTFTPSVLADWDSDADPGDVDDALNQLAAHVDDLLTAPPAHAHDASAITFTPSVLTDWNGDADPGDTDDALNQLAARVDDVEAHTHAAPDASVVTYTPAVLTDWNSDADPGDTDDALNQLAARVDDLEATPPAHAHDASVVTYTPTDATDWNGDVDPGDVDDALNQLADRLIAVETTPPAHAHDASAVTFTPSVLTDWDGNADPGDVDDALNQLAAHVDDLLAAPPAHVHDASVVTFTPAVLADWNSDADPGDTDDALNQLAARVDDLEATPPAHVHDAGVVTYTPLTVGDWNSDADPGDVDNALDQLAANLRALIEAPIVTTSATAALTAEAVLTAGTGITVTPSSGTVTIAIDAANIPFTPVDATDWNGDVDPGDVNDALNQLADRLISVEATPPAHVHDASVVTYTPAVLTDWDGNADPGDVDNALDQLAAHVDDLLAAPPAHVHDASVVTFTPSVLTDWDGNADPGDVDDALNQLAAHVDDLLAAPPAHVHDASVVTYTPAVLADWDTDTDPGDVDNALDQLAERVDDLELAPPSHGHDASVITYTPAVLADWDTDADPGDLDDALNQLAERVDDLETSGTGAPADAQYVVLATSAGLNNEQVLTAGTGITITPTAPNGNVTVAIDTENIPFTPATVANWNSGVDPGDVDDALDQLAANLNPLLPPSAPVLDLLSFTTSNGVAGYNTWNTGNPITNYTTASSAGSVNNAGDALDTLMTASTNTHGVYDWDTIASVAGVLNGGEAAHAYSYPANAFSPGGSDGGSVNDLKILVNGSIKHTVNLLTFGSGNSVNANGTGFTSLSAATPVKFPDLSPFTPRTYRTGSWVVDNADMTRGYNVIKTQHVTDSGTTTTVVHEFLLDDENTATTYTSESISGYTGAGSKYLSGVQYHTSATATYNVTINNAYRNTYASGNQITYAVTNLVALSAEALAASAGNEAASVTKNKAITASGLRLLNASLTARTTVDRTVQSDTQSSGGTLAGVLIDNASASSGNLQNLFDDENYRIQADDDFNANLSGDWDEMVSLAGADAGHNTGLLTYNSVICAPNQGANGGNFSTIANGPAGNPNYSGITTGTRYYFGYFTSTSSQSNFRLNIQGTSATTTLVNKDTAVTGNNIRISLRFPKETGWMDVLTNFSEGSFGSTAESATATATVGCYSASLGNDTTIPTDSPGLGVTIGTKNTAGTYDKVYYRIEASAAWAGNLSSITINWGATEDAWVIEEQE